MMRDPTPRDEEEHSLSSSDAQDEGDFSDNDDPSSGDGTPPREFTVRRILDDIERKEFLVSWDNAWINDDELPNHPDVSEMIEHDDNHNKSLVSFDDSWQPLDSFMDADGTMTDQLREYLGEADGPDQSGH